MLDHLGVTKVSSQLPTDHFRATDSTDELFCLVENAISHAQVQWAGNEGLGIMVAISAVASFFSSQYFSFWVEFSVWPVICELEHVNNCMCSKSVCKPDLKSSVLN